LSSSGGGGASTGWSAEKHDRRVVVEREI
jgi:hypothetical protein